MANIVLAAVAVYVYYTALQTLFSNDSSVIASSYGGHYQFLTILGVCASLLQQLVAIAAWATGLRSLAALQSVLLQISAPVEILISVLYWSIKAVDPNLVLDPRFAAKLSLPLDMKLHLFPALFQFISAVDRPMRLWHAGIAKTFLGFLAVTAAYWVWVHHTFSQNLFFPYPLFSVVDEYGRAGIFAGSALLITFSYKVIQSVQRKFN